MKNGNLSSLIRVFAGLRMMQLIRLSTCHVHLFFSYSFASLRTDFLSFSRPRLSWFDLSDFWHLTRLGSLEHVSVRVSLTITQEKLHFLPCARLKSLTRAHLFLGAFTLKCLVFRTCADSPTMLGNLRGRFDEIDKFFSSWAYTNLSLSVWFSLSLSLRGKRNASLPSQQPIFLFRVILFTKSFFPSNNWKTRNLRVEFSTLWQARVSHALV